ncbi:cation diffusion facilitator family transporter [Pyrinomonas sp.]|uniref:cation diffusion facilitator family transporter n=1 Tax=Pyrinomonas sp. TaxID=2080306 RepID=UPI00332AC4D9
MTAAFGSHTSLSLAEESRAKRRAARLSVIIASFLVALKAATGWITGSISVWASLLDSTMDIFASAINFVAVRAAARPADEDHAYGHGKAESLAGLFQAGVISASGFFLIVEALRRIASPRPVASTKLGIAAMVIASVVSAVLVARLRRVARATDSPALHADASHYLTDIWTNLGALVALVLVAQTEWLMIDPLISLAISLYIIWSAARVGKESVDVLMDRRLPLDVDEKVAAIINRYRDQGVRGFHDLRTRRSGSVKFIDLHLEVDRQMRLDEAHELTVKVLRAIEDEIPRARVQIHTDPV